MDAMLDDPLTSEGLLKPVGILLLDWAPDGKSPATSPGPTGLHYQRLIRLLTSLTARLQPDHAPWDVALMEGCIFGADPATAVS